MSQTQREAIGRPAAAATDLPYHAPPAPANPVFRGLPLYYGAQVVASVGSIQQFLWSNAGFGKLRNRPELEHAEARYDPTVIIRSSALEKKDRASLDGSGGDDAALLTEDFSSRRPRSTVHRSVLDYHEAYKSGTLTPTAVAKAILPLIQRDRDREPASKHGVAFTETHADLVLQAAERSTQRYAANKPLSPLDGVPVAVKDSSDLTGYRKCNGSRLDFTDKRDRTAHCVQQWLDAGAVVVGKANMHEAGMDTSGNNPNYGTPLNPHNSHYYTGGSSSGSAYAVVAGLVPLAHGADGGGSIRIPASYCGLYGLKPSHSRVSIHPLPNVEKGSCVDGPIGANMADVEIGFRIMARPATEDPVSTSFPPPQSCAEAQPSQRTRVIGICKPWFDRAAPAVQKACWRLLDHLTAQLGYAVVDIALPLLHEGQIAHAMTILAEVCTVVAPAQLHRLTPPNKVLLSVGARSTAVDLLQAQKLRSVLMRHLAALFDRHPGMMIVTPTTPEAGWHVAAGEADLKYGCSDANTSVRSMEFVWLANFSGCPALTVPVGYADPIEGHGGVPIGLMAMGEWCSDEDLLRFGYEAEQWLAESSGHGRARPASHEDVFALAGEHMGN